MTHRRIIIVDDHPLFRAALRQTLSGGDASIGVEEAGDLAGLTAALEANRECDLVLLDLNMPGVRGFSGLLLLRAQYPDVPVMIISAVEDAAVVRRAFELGASGYLHKSVGPPEIRRAIETVLQGEVFVPEGVDLTASDEQSALLRRLGTLTPQQVRVLMMLQRRPDEQADRLRALDLGGDGQGARLGDPAKARRRQPHPGGDRRGQDRGRSVRGAALDRSRAGLTRQPPG